MVTAFGQRKWWALGALSLADMVVGLDATVLSMALPTLSRTLHASETDLQWFSSGFMLMLAACMLPAGVLGDRFGRRRITLAALALFGAGSVACAYSTTAGEFLCARLVLGIAGAGIIVMALSAFTVLFTEDERPKAIGIWAGVSFVALPAGPVLGGWLLTHHWWGWVFLINVPVTVLGMAAARVLLPESRAAHRPALDPVGLLLAVTGLVALTSGFIQAGGRGWGCADVWTSVVLGLAASAGFVRWERRLAARPDGRPLVNLALFHSLSYTGGVLLAAVVSLALTGILFMLPQYYQGVLGVDAMRSGILLLPMIGGLAAGSVRADRLARLVGTDVTVAVGFSLLTAGFAIGSRTSDSSSTGFLVVWTVICGVGMGIITATAVSAALVRLSAERSGVGSAMMQALQKVGGPFGSAIMGSVLAGGYHDRLSLDGVPPESADTVKESVFGGVAVANRLHSPPLLGSVRDSFTHGMDTGLLAYAGVAAAGVLLTLISRSRWFQRIAPRCWEAAAGRYRPR